MSSKNANICHHLPSFLGAKIAPIVKLVNRIIKNALTALSIDI